MIFSANRRNLALALDQFARVTAQFKMRHHLAGQYPQRLLLLLRQRARHMSITHSVPSANIFRVDQRGARIEADAWFARDHRILRKAFILQWHPAR